MANVDCRIARALQSYTITYPSPDETLLATPVALPTAEPTDPQISYTIGSQHLPTVSPAGLEYTLTAILYAAGKNTDAASQTVYYRILKNGVSVATGSASVAANTYYTWNHYNFLGVVPGDVLACKLWATSANANWDYKALAVMLTGLLPAGRLLSDVSLTSASLLSLTLGNPLAGSAGQPYAYQGDDPFSRIMNNDSAFRFKSLYSGQTYRGYRLYYGDYLASSTMRTSATYRPYYDYNRRPTAISFRPLTLRV